jgi:hypothetical protein
LARVRSYPEFNMSAHFFRFVTFDFTVYNANVNLFAVVKIVFELPATGNSSLDLRVGLLNGNSKEYCKKSVPFCY